jgi:hypothetical protein
VTYTCAIRLICIGAEVSLVMKSRSSTFGASIRFRVSALARVTRVATEATEAGWGMVRGRGSALLISKSGMKTFAPQPPSTCHRDVDKSEF